MSSSRRQFLQQTMATLATLSAVNAGGARGARAADGLKRRRHLINLIGFGGWDSQWFHAKFRSSELVDSAGNRIADLKHHPRFSDSDQFSQPHPRHPTHMLGMGLSSVFSSSDLQELMIWKGLMLNGEHGVGNTVLLHGSAASYAMSFSQIVAQGLGRDYIRPLHYVQVAPSSGHLATSTVSATGVAIPINIANIGAFGGLSAVNPKDVSDVARRELLHKTLRRLAGEVGTARLKLQASRDLYSSFATAFQGATEVTGSNIHESIEFLSIFRRYAIALRQSVVDFVANAPAEMRTSFLENPNMSATGITWLGAPHSQFNDAPVSIDTYVALKRASEANPSDATARAKMNAEAARLRPLLTSVLNTGANGNAWMWWRPMSVVPTDGRRTIMDMAFAYALAEYLVVTDRSAVVDVPAFLSFGEDWHTNSHHELVRLVLAFTALRELIRGLRGTEVKGQPGRNMLDLTTVVMHTEFDRSPEMSGTDGGRVGDGTSHGRSVSILMAGAGTRRGSVIGGTKTGPLGRFKDPDFAPWRYCEPLPINRTTGVPDPNGLMVSTQALLPTVLRMFSVQVPANQIGAESAVDVAIDSSSTG